MKHPTCLALAVIGLLYPHAAHAINLITNDTFTSGTEQWSLKLGSGAAATLDTNSGWGRVSIANGGSSKSLVGLEHTLSLPLLNGLTYTIAFDAKATAGKSIDVLLRSPGGSILGGSYGVWTSTASSRVTVSYTHTQADAADAYLSLRLGGNNIGFFIDNVTVARSGSSSQLLTQNANGTWNFPTLTVGGKTWNAGTYDFSYAGYNYGEREDFTGIPAASQTIVAANGDDITDELNIALATLPSGGTVWIPSGTFRIGAGLQSDTVKISTSHTVIRGAGIGRTKLIVDGDYHAAPDIADRQSATFGKGVITFQRTGTNGSSQNWIYGAPLTNVTTAISLGARTLTVADASGFAVGGTIVVQQIMWQGFVEKNAYNPTAHPSTPWRWTTYSGTTPLFNHKRWSLSYQRKVLSKNGNTLTIDVPIPYPLDPANKAVTVGRLGTPELTNCGLRDLTFTAEAETGAANDYNSLGTTISVQGLSHGLFKNVEIASFRSLGFATVQSVNVSFLNCTAANALNRGGGGAGYGFYINGQNLLYNDCKAANLRHGYTTNAPQTSNIVIKNCTSFNYGFNPDITTGGEAVDDTHAQFTHGILWDNHYSREAGLMMVNRGTLSSEAYETCGWSVVWNYENEGLNTPDAHGKQLRHNLLAATPADFGLVIGAHTHRKTTGVYLMIQDGYSRFPYSWGNAESGVAPHIGTPSTQVPAAGRVLYELTEQPVTPSLYDIQFGRRAKLLP